MRLRSFLSLAMFAIICLPFAAARAQSDAEFNGRPLHSCAISTPIEFFEGVKVERRYFADGRISDFADARMPIAESSGVPLRAMRRIEYTDGADLAPAARSVIQLWGLLDRKAGYAPDDTFLFKLSGGNRPPIELNAVSERDSAKIDLKLTTFDARFATTNRVEVTLIRRDASGKTQSIGVTHFDLAEVRRLEKTAAALRANLVRLAAASTPACTEDSPDDSIDFSYDCGREWRDESGSFSVSTYFQEWQTEVAPGLSIKLSNRFFLMDPPSRTRFALWYLVPPSGKERGPQLNGMAFRAGILFIGGKQIEDGDLATALTGTAPVTIMVNMRPGPIDLKSMIQEPIIRTGSRGRADRWIDLPQTIFREPVARMMAEYDAAIERARAPEGKCTLERKVTNPRNEVVITS